MTGKITVKVKPVSYAAPICFHPGECEKCPAGGHWDFIGPGLWCFASWYFLDLPVKNRSLKKCEEVGRNCPLIGHEHLYQ